jgi:hypothetical protein
MGTLYYGDNLEILRRYLKEETVNLVYLDPPFNSAQNYNAFFQEKDGSAAASQIRAFEDTWSWNQESQRVYEELVLQVQTREDHSDEARGSARIQAVSRRDAGRAVAGPLSPPSTKPSKKPPPPNENLPRTNLCRGCDPKFAFKTEIAR